MKFADVKDGAQLHYTSILGRGPSKPVVVIGPPYMMNGQPMAWVKRLDMSDAERGFCVHVDALYKRPIAEGVDLRARSRKRAADAL